MSTPSADYGSSCCNPERRTRYAFSRTPAMANMRNVASARTCRAHRAFMSPVEFAALVAGWGAGLVLLLFISAVARYLI
jgi:hypothetical protein